MRKNQENFLFHLPQIPVMKGVLVLAVLLVFTSGCITPQTAQLVVALGGGLQSFSLDAFVPTTTTTTTTTSTTTTTTTIEPAHRTDNQTGNISIEAETNWTYVANNFMKFKSRYEGNVSIEGSDIKVKIINIGGPNRADVSLDGLSKTLRERQFVSTRDWDVYVKMINYYQETFGGILMPSGDVIMKILPKQENRTMGALNKEEEITLEGPTPLTFKYMVANTSDPMYSVETRLNGSSIYLALDQEKTTDHYDFYLLDIEEDPDMITFFYTPKS